MPFGLTTAPSVYQSINNILASLMRQYLIPNVLYIDDRCIVVEPGEEYLGWLITSLSTSCGHFLSLHKTNVKEAKPIFNYLGFEFDCPKVTLIQNNFTHFPILVTDGITNFRKAKTENSYIVGQTPF